MSDSNFNSKQFGSAKTKVEEKLRRDFQSKNQLTIMEAPKTAFQTLLSFITKVAHEGFPNTGVHDTSCCAYTGSPCVRKFNIYNT